MDKNKIIELVEKKLSLREIANELNISKSTLCYWMKKYSLQTFRKAKGKLPSLEYKCSCGETNPENFYGKKRFVCSKCHNQYTLQKGQEKRLKIIEKMGGQCVSCGYNKYSCSLEIHHKYPEKKDPFFHGIRSWSWDRIEKEIQTCV